MRRLLLASAFAIVPLTGCGESARLKESAVTVDFASPPPASAPIAAERSDKSGMMGGMGGMMGGMMMKVGDGAAAATVAFQPPPEGAVVAPNAPGISRRVVYDASLDLLVDSIEPASTRVPELVEDVQGYISDQNTTGSPGARRSQRWKIRVPVERFESFVASVRPLGELEQFNRTSQDVTAEFYDVEARIKNKRVEEQTLSKILQDRSGKLEDVLKVEMELSRVRGEIEQMQGRMRVLENLSSLATLTLNVHERDKFAPAAPVVADFRTQMARTWEDSLTSLADLGKAIVLFVVSWAPWTPLLAILALVAWILIRRLIPILKRLPQILNTPITPIRTPRGD